MFVGLNSIDTCILSILCGILSCGPEKKAKKSTQNVSYSGSINTIQRCGLVSYDLRANEKYNGLIRSITRLLKHK